ncbi:MAG: hypothetical protein EON60_06125 [Alphaproteobacteria bacterium]|nr:MAG: hypothetical protein EON60_06125 [Alphaproteobacteria bacterium]
MRKKEETLLGKDTRSGGLLSMLGGSFDQHETNPYEVSVREGRDEGGHDLFFILLNEMPLMFYTDNLTGRVLDAEKHRQHPAHPGYDGHPVVLRFTFDVLEISGAEPCDCDPEEITDIAWRPFNLEEPSTMRISTFHSLTAMEWGAEPKEIVRLTPNFKCMYEAMREQLNVSHDQAYTWSNHKGTEEIHEGQPFGKLLLLLDEKWKNYTTFQGSSVSTF